MSLYIYWEDFDVDQMMKLSVKRENEMRRAENYIILSVCISLMAPLKCFQKNKKHIPSSKPQ